MIQPLAVSNKLLLHTIEINITRKEIRHKTLYIEYDYTSRRVQKQGNLIYDVTDQDTEFPWWEI